MENRTQPKKKRRWILWTFVAIISLFVLSAILSDKDEASKVTSVKSKSSSNEVAKGKIGDTVKAGDMEYKIISVETKKVIKDSMGTSYKPGAGQYLVLNLQVKNTGKEKITADASMFKIKDKEEAEYSADSQVDLWLNEHGTNSLGFFLEAINPHAIKTAKIAFDVPIKKTDEFVFEGGAGMISFKDPAIIELKK